MKGAILHIPIQLMDLTDLLEEHIWEPLEDAQIEFLVSVRITNYYPGRPAVMYLRNGDPGYPAEPEEYEFKLAHNWLSCIPWAIKNKPQKVVDVFKEYNVEIMIALKAFVCSKQFDAWVDDVFQEAYSKENYYDDSRDE
jgi:hypothetical protein